jgi:arylsulfatase A
MTMLRFARIGPARVVLLLAMFLPARAAWSAERPNIVLIMADDFGYECVAANGGTSYQTPHLDALARSGMRFEHCHVQPLCTPTRVQLMTGLSNRQNYIRFGTLDPHATTFAHLLKDAGYATGIAGKWQLEGGFEGPNRFGFDEYCLWQLNRRPSRYANPGLEINGRRVDYTQGEYGPDLINAHVLDFIERNKDRPFLAYYPMLLTHGPFDPTPDSDDWDPAAAGEGVGRPARKQRHFADMVAYMDKLVGRLVAKLDELGLRQKTLILFTGDNGTGAGIRSMMGDRVVIGGKGKTVDTGTHVPLIASLPGVIPAGRVCGDLVDSTDFLPTILDFAGVELPSDIPFDGRSFAPQLRGEPGTPREWIYCWYLRGTRAADRKTASEHVRNQRYKLYRGGEFYDVVSDPDEERPLDTAKLAAEARDVCGVLQKALESIHVPAEPLAGKRSN